MALNRALDAETTRGSSVAARKMSFDLPNLSHAVPISEAQLLAAGPLVQRGGEEREALGVQGRHEGGVGVLPLHIGLSHPPRRPPSGVVAKR